MRFFWKKKPTLNNNILNINGKYYLRGDIFTDEENKVLDHAINKMKIIVKKIDEELNKSDIFIICLEKNNLCNSQDLRTIIIKEILNKDALHCCKCYFKNLQRITNAYNKLNIALKIYDNFEIDEEQESEVRIQLENRLELLYKISNELIYLGLDIIIESDEFTKKICDDFDEKLNKYIEMCFDKINKIYEDNKENIDHILSYTTDEYDYYEILSENLHKFFGGEIDNCLNDTIYPEELKQYKYYKDDKYDNFDKFRSHLPKGGKRKTIRKRKLIRKRKTIGKHKINRKQKTNRKRKIIISL
jgi:hypothetical protein